MKTNFTRDDLYYIYITMLTSIGFSGYDKFLYRVDLPKEEIENIIKKLYKAELDVFDCMEEDTLKKIVIIFGQSCLHVGPVEMSIVVGASWQEIMSLYEKLRTYCSYDRKIAVF